MRYFFRFILIFYAFALISCSTADDSGLQIDMTRYYMKPGYEYEYIDELGNTALFRYETVQLNGRNLVQDSEYDFDLTEWNITGYEQITTNGIYKYDDLTDALLLLYSSKEGVTTVIDTDLYVTPHLQNEAISQMAGTVFENCNDIVRLEVHRQTIDPFDGSIWTYNGYVYFARGIGRIYQQRNFTTSNSPVAAENGTVTWTYQLLEIRDIETQIPVDVLAICS